MIDGALHLSCLQNTEFKPERNFWATIKMKIHHHKCLRKTCRKEWVARFNRAKMCPACKSRKFSTVVLVPERKEV